MAGASVRVIQGWGEPGLGFPVTLTPGTLRAGRILESTLRSFLQAPCGVITYWTDNEWRPLDFQDGLTSDTFAPGAVLSMRVQDLAQKCWDEGKVPPAEHGPSQVAGGSGGAEESGPGPELDQAAGPTTRTSWADTSGAGWEEEGIPGDSPTSSQDSDSLYPILPEDELVLEEPLGYGLCGTVSLGRLRGEQVAVKCVDACNSPELVEHLQQEALVLNGRLSHLQGVCVPRVHFCGYWGYGMLFVLATSVIRGQHPHPGEPISASAGMAVKALEPIHASKVAHRDLSPENILVEDSGKVWFLDFGSSLVDPPDEKEYERERQRLEAIFSKCKRALAASSDLVRKCVEEGKVPPAEHGPSQVAGGSGGAAESGPGPELDQAAGPTTRALWGESGAGWEEEGISEQAADRDNDSDSQYPTLPPDALVLEKPLGYGLCGTVSLGRLRGEQVAVKCVDACNSPELVEHLQQEALVLNGRLSHLQGVCVPCVHFCGYWRYGMIFVLATSVIRGQHPHPGEPISASAGMAVKALQPIHASKVAHGDLSPENILVEDSGKVWFLDFGSSLVDPDEKEYEDERQQLEAIFSECKQASAASSDGVYQ